jgi:Tol biopolymer transport system component
MGACGTLMFLLAACGGGGGGSGAAPKSPSPVAPPQRGSLQFTEPAYSTNEAATTLIIGIVRESGTDGAVSVALSASGGSATSGVDHVAIGTTVAFADGEGGTKTFNIVVIDDASDEPDETITLSLASPAGGATLGARTSATVNILDDDAAPTFSVGGTVSGLQGSGLVLRNNGGGDLAIAANGAFEFPVELNIAAGYEVTIATQPSSPEQECTVTNGAGTLSSADVTHVSIDCVSLESLQTVVYAQEVNGQYDLHAVRENGLRNTALATSADDEHFAGVGPGGRILFVRNDVLFSILADGTGLATVDDSGQSPMPQGMTMNGVLPSVDGRIFLERRVPHAVDDHNDLVAEFADGSGSVTLAASENDEEFEGVTPGGRVVFRRLPASGGNVDLFSINPDGTGLATLAASTGYEEYQGVTPAGRIIFRRDAGVGQQDIYSVNEDGTGTTPIAATAQDERFAAVTPAGQVIFTRSNDLYIVDADGTDERLLAGGTQIESFLGVAPSGVVVFLRRPIGSPDRNIYAVNPDGTGEVPLATSADYETFAGITPEGRVIYHASPIVSGASPPPDLYSIELDGSGRVRLTDTPDDEESAQLFSPTGQVVFVRVTSDQSDVMAIGADDSSSAIPLAATAAREAGYAITTNGRLLFQRDQGTDFELWSIGLDGSDPQVLALGPGFRMFSAIF